MRFVVDGMLGKLARWLRISGHDVVYSNDLRRSDDESILELALREDRILITSDVGLYKRCKKHRARCVLLRSEGTVNQLVELSRFLGRPIPVDFESSRCPECNGELVEIGAEEVRNHVPESIAQRYESFWRCTGCGKVYWEGSHWRSIIKTVNEYKRRIKSAELG